MGYKYRLWVIITWKIETLYFVFASLFGFVLASICKKMFKRKRPCHNNFVKDNGSFYKSIKNIVSCLMCNHENKPSMPSGDCVQIVIISYTLSDYNIFNFGYYWTILIPITIYGRIYFKKHWFGDCIIGSLLGWFAIFITKNMDEYLASINVTFYRW